MALVVAACTPAPAAPATQAPATDSPTAAGGYIVEYHPATTDEGRAAEQMLRSADMLDRTVAAVNKIIDLQTTVPIVVGEQITFFDEPVRGPMASGDGNVIIVPLEWVATVFDDNTAAYSEVDTAEEIEENTLQTVQFATLHEIGHNVIAVLDIPVTGSEEDAVDQFALVMLAAIAEDEDGLIEAALVTLAAADSFEATLSGDAKTEDDWWDEHTVTEQRARNLVCLAAGSSDLALAALEDTIPAERHVRCPMEFRQAFTSWLRLLEGHYQPGVEEEVRTVLTNLNDAAERAAQD